MGRAIRGRLSEILVSAWRPNEAAAAFAARHGFRHVRCFWKMDRATAGCPEPVWPPGVSPLIFDGSEPALAGWNDAYNASFAEHYHYVPATMELARQTASAKHFLRDGLVLAYRDGRCVGLCRPPRSPARRARPLPRAPRGRGMTGGRGARRSAGSEP